MPSQEYSYLPSSMRAGATRRTRLTGTASPTPALTPLSLIICVFTPMTRPSRSSSGPPELPGLTAASV